MSIVSTCKAIDVQDLPDEMHDLAMDYFPQTFDMGQNTFLRLEMKYPEEHEEQYQTFVKFLLDSGLKETDEVVLLIWW